MKRSQIWMVAGTAMLGLSVPAFALARGGDGTPDDDGVPGEVRGNCDEAEHRDDPACATVVLPVDTAATSVPSPTVTVTTPSTIATTPTVPTTNAPAAPTTAAGTVPSASIPTSTPTGTAPSVTTPGNTIVDISGPCDEAEHATDPRCTGAGTDDHSGHGRGGDDSGHGDDDDRSGHGGDDDDDRSGHGGDDDDSSGHGSDHDDD